MTPDKVPNPLPVQCVLDRGQLTTIATTVDSIDKKIDEILSYEGPIAKLRGRVSAVEALAIDTSSRVEKIETTGRDRDKEVNKLALKVATWSSGLTASLTAAIFWVSRFFTAP